MAANVEKIMDQINKYVEQNLAPVKQVADQLGVKPAILVCGLGVGLLFFLFFGVGSSIILSIIGFGYPGYMSFKAIEEKKDGEKFWCKYWVILGFLTFMETFLDVFLMAIPFYETGKLAFVLYLYLPKTQGAETIYAAVSPLLVKQIPVIDKFLLQLSGGK